MWSVGTSGRSTEIEVGGKGPDDEEGPQEVVTVTLHKDQAFSCCWECRPTLPTLPKPSIVLGYSCGDAPGAKQQHQLPPVFRAVPVLCSILAMRGLMNGPTQRRCPVGCRSTWWVGERGVEEVQPHAKMLTKDLDGSMAMPQLSIDAAVAVDISSAKGSVAAKSWRRWRQ